MPPDVTQEGDVLQLVQPAGIVDHDRIRRPVAELQEPLEHLQDALLVRLDLLGRQDLAGFVLAGRIADFGGAAAHQDDGLVTGLLQAAQRHDLNQASDMQAGPRAIESDIGRDGFLEEQCVQGFGLRAGMICPSRFQGAEEFGAKFRRACHAMAQNGEGLGV